MNAKSIAEVAGDLVVLSVKYEATRAEAGSFVTADTIADALGEFMECVRYLNTRRSKGAVLALESEADVQDAAYLMLRPWILDLVPENPTDRTANRFSIGDFLVASAKTIVEVKYVRDKNHGKSISAELHDDIEQYRHHNACSNIVFFIYDPDALIPDKEQLRRSIEEHRAYGGREIRCKLIVRP